MRTFEAVTTFNFAGYETYGLRMVKTFKAFWPRLCPLRIYSEDRMFLDTMYDGAEKLPSPLWLDAFKRRNGNDRAGGWRNASYDFRFDAVKFAHKSAAMIDALEHSCADVLIWLDGDIVTHAHVSHDFLETLIDEHALISWLNRDRLYPETGFFAVNLRHPMATRLAAIWRAFYETDSLFELQQWHDAYVLQKIVERLGAPTRSLSGFARSTSHPLARGPLAVLFDHLKGSRKSLDHSPEHRVLA